jgi:hypothetical protein
VPQAELAAIEERCLILGALNLKQLAARVSIFVSAACLEMLLRHIPGRHFEEDDQPTLAWPARGPVLENCGVHGYFVILCL